MNSNNGKNKVIATVIVADLRRFTEFLGLSESFRNAINSGKIIVVEEKK
jgi:hypothetical protein